MTTSQDAARLRSIGAAKRRLEARLGAMAPEIVGLAAQLALIADGIQVEALQPKVLEGKLRRIINALRATVEGQ